jgi:hypothetical protein
LRCRSPSRASSSPCRQDLHLASQARTPSHASPASALGSAWTGQMQCPQNSTPCALAASATTPLRPGLAAIAANQAAPRSKSTQLPQHQLSSIMMNIPPNNMMQHHGAFPPAVLSLSRSSAPMLAILQTCCLLLLKRFPSASMPSLAKTALVGIALHQFFLLGEADPPFCCRLGVAGRGRHASKRLPRST